MHGTHEVEEQLGYSIIESMKIALFSSNWSNEMGRSYIFTMQFKMYRHFSHDRQTHVYKHVQSLGPRCKCLTN